VIMSGLAPGDTVIVQNAASVTIHVYPVPNCAIDALTATTGGYPLDPGKMQVFRQFSDSQCYSEQLG